MRILLAGDTHGNTRHVQYLLKIAKEQDCDSIFQVGDFGAWEHFASGVEYFDTVDRHARLHGIPVYWLDGNHDKTSLVLDKYGDNKDEEGFILCRPHLRYAPRGHVWEWAGKTFIALGGAYSVDKDYRLAVEAHQGQGGGRHWFPEEEMTDQDMETFILKSPVAVVDYMFTHDKPRGSNPGWNRKDIPECWHNQDRIQKAMTALKPELLVHGHLHYLYNDTVAYEGGETKILGLDCDPAAAEGYRYRQQNSWAVLDVETGFLSFD